MAALLHSADGASHTLFIWQSDVPFLVWMYLPVIETLVNGARAVAGLRWNVTKSQVHNTQDATRLAKQGDIFVWVGLKGFRSVPWGAPLFYAVVLACGDTWTSSRSVHP